MRRRLNVETRGFLLLSLGGVADDVFLEQVVPAPHRHPDAVLVVLEGVAGYLGVEGLHQGHPSVAVVVDVVVWWEGGKRRRVGGSSSGRSDRMWKLCKMILHAPPVSSTKKKKMKKVEMLNFCKLAGCTGRRGRPVFFSHTKKHSAA